MNVLQQNIDSVNAIIKIQIEQADYQEKVQKAIRNIRQKANIPGFRPGMAPASLVKKMYEKSALIEEINRMVSEKLFSYIRENNLQILGEPLPNVTEQQEIDFNAQVDFEFCFDIGLAPAIDIAFSKKDKVPFYQIEVTDDMVEEQIKANAQRFGSTQSADTFEGKDMLKGDLIELDEQGNEKEGGLKVEASMMIPYYFKDEAETAKFEGVKTGDSIVFNPSKASAGSDAELAHILRVKKEEVAGYTSDFKLTIGEITRFTSAEMGEELYKKVYGEDTDVTTEEAYRAKIKEGISLMMSPEGEYKFGLDVKALAEKKVGDIQFPQEFLKRWLIESKEGKTEESVDEEMPKMLKELTWHLIKEKIVKDNDIQVNEEDLMEIAKVDTKMQFAQYGLNDIPEEYLIQYAQEMLKKKEQARGFVDRAIEEKVFAWIKSQVTLQEKSITRDEFYKLIGE